MQIRYTENKMRYRRSVSYFPYVKIAVYVFHACFSVQISAFYPESVRSEFKKIKTQAYYYRKLGMDTWKIPRDYGVKSAYNGQFAAVFLREITKSK
jgi:hypothetical protein